METLKFVNEFSKPAREIMLKGNYTSFVAISGTRSVAIATINKNNELELNDFYLLKELGFAVDSRGCIRIANPEPVAKPAEQEPVYCWIKGEKQYFKLMGSQDSVDVVVTDENGVLINAPFLCRISENGIRRETSVSSEIGIKLNSRGQVHVTNPDPVPFTQSDLDRVKKEGMLEAYREIKRIYDGLACKWEGFYDMVYAKIGDLKMELGK